MGKQFETWTACISRSILGAVVPYVRRHGGKRLTALEAPSYVREYLELEPAAAAMGMTFDEAQALTIDAGTEGVRHVRIQRFPKRLKGLAGQPMNVFVTFVVRNPQWAPPRPKLTVREHGPLIRDFKGLLRFFEADEPRSLNRRNKDTECGASISVQLADGTWIHNGDEQWTSLTGAEKLRGFTIQTIVEGSDAEVNSDTFELPCTQAEVRAWMKDMEATADELWKQANEVGGREEVE